MPIYTLYIPRWISNSSLCAKLRFLEWVSHLVILPQPYLFLLLAWNMLNPELLGLLFHECSNVPRIPQLASDS